MLSFPAPEKHFYKERIFFPLIRKGGYSIYYSLKGKKEDYRQITIWAFWIFKYEFYIFW